ncbi:MAG: UvrB/UvrC motif-containing protein [Ruminococcus sp.]|nr:UvrB/UvrC motif-containing protein [Ruminococcus sp.]
MKCQKCKINDATTKIKRVVNGEYTEYILCADCAHEMGFDNVFDNTMPDMFGGLLKSIFGAALPSRSQATRCPVCSSTYGDITNTGKVGCANCYKLFYSELLPSVKRIHGNTKHSGKHPEMLNSQEDKIEPAKVSELDTLKAELEKAIEEQNFELCAELRDKIKEREGK